jgi:hypothetical protein
MKDFYGLWSLSRDFSFDGRVLSEAVRRTFARRESKLPKDKPPLVFTSAFYLDEDKRKQWSGFCDKNKRYVSQISLEEVCLAMAAFLALVVEAVSRNEILQRNWRAAGPWNSPFDSGE